MLFLAAPTSSAVYFANSVAWLINAWNYSRSKLSALLQVLSSSCWILLEQFAVASVGGEIL